MILCTAKIKNLFKVKKEENTFLKNLVAKCGHL